MAPKEPKPWGPLSYWWEPIKVIKDPKLVALKAKRREELVEQFYKRYLAPQSYSQEAANTIFDPAIQRYMSTYACQEEYFRPTGRTFIYYMTWIIAPICVIYAVNRWWRDDMEYKYRTGQIAYKDRPYKFGV